MPGGGNFVSSERARCGASPDPSWQKGASIARVSGRQSAGDPAVHAGTLVVPKGLVPITTPRAIRRSGLLKVFAYNFPTAYTAPFLAGNQRLPLFKAQDGSIKIQDTIAIMIHLCRKFNVPDHWYPGELHREAVCRRTSFSWWRIMGALEKSCAPHLRSL